MKAHFFQPDGYAGACALLDLDDPPTAIFASNDVMAMGVMDAVRNRELRIPDDISVVGFDNIPQSAMVYPPLTTVQQPLEQMGRVAAQMLIGILNDVEKDSNRIELPTELIVRSSTSTPRGQGWLTVEVTQPCPQRVRPLAQERSIHTIKLYANLPFSSFV